MIALQFFISGKPIKYYDLIRERVLITQPLVIEENAKFANKQVKCEVGPGVACVIIKNGAKVEFVSSTLEGDLRAQCIFLHSSSELFMKEVKITNCGDHLFGLFVFDIT